MTSLLGPRAQYGSINFSNKCFEYFVELYIDYKAVELWEFQEKDEIYENLD